MKHKFIGISKKKFSRNGVALEGEITTVTIAGPAEILVVSMGAQPSQIEEIAHLINAAPALLDALAMAIKANDWHIEAPKDSFGAKAYEAAISAIAKARGES